MSKIYVTVCTETGESGYGFQFYHALQVRRDGRRFRYVAGGFQWKGNEGGYRNSKPLYFDRQAGRAVLREIRSYRIDAAKGRLPGPHSPMTLAVLNHRIT